MEIQAGAKKHLLLSADRKDSHSDCVDEHELFTSTQARCINILQQFVASELESKQDQEILSVYLLSY